MRGQIQKSVIAENKVALSAKQAHDKWMGNRPKMCWKCQKDKPVKGGYLNIIAGLHQFVCKDCVEARLRSKECQDQSHQNP
jgi:hypothetical protein